MDIPFDISSVDISSATAPEAITSARKSPIAAARIAPRTVAAVKASINDAIQPYAYEQPFWNNRRLLIVGGAGAALLLVMFMMRRSR